MDNNSRKKNRRGGQDAHRAEALNHPTGDGLPRHAADLINRALFEDWLHQYGSWDAFLDTAGKKKTDPDDEGPTTH